MTAETKTSLSSKIRMAILIAIAAVFIIFSIANAATVEVNFLVAKASMPRFVLLFGTFGLGLLGGWLLKPRRSKDNPSD